MRKARTARRVERLDLRRNAATSARTVEVTRRPRRAHAGVGWTKRAWRIATERAHLSASCSSRAGMGAIMEFIRFDAHDLVPVRGRYAYSPSAAETRREMAAPQGGRFFQLLAEIEISGDAKGVICAQQSRG